MLARQRIASGGAGGVVAKRGSGVNAMRGGAGKTGTRGGVKAVGKGGRASPRSKGGRELPRSKGGRPSPVAERRYPKMAVLRGQTVALLEEITPVFAFYAYSALGVKHADASYMTDLAIHEYVERHFPDVPVQLLYPSDRTVLKLAWERLRRGRERVPVWELRREVESKVKGKPGWARVRFDNLLERLAKWRDVKLVEGDAGKLESDQIRDCVIVNGLKTELEWLGEDV